MELWMSHVGIGYHAQIWLLHQPARLLSMGDGISRKCRQIAGRRSESAAGTTSHRFVAAVGHGHCHAAIAVGIGPQARQARNKRRGSP